MKQTTRGAATQRRTIQAKNNIRATQPTNQPTLVSKVLVSKSSRVKVPIKPGFLQNVPHEIRFERVLASLSPTARRET